MRLKKGAHGQGESAGTETDCVPGGRGEGGGEQELLGEGRGELTLEPQADLAQGRGMARVRLFRAGAWETWEAVR